MPIRGKEARRAPSPSADCDCHYYFFFLAFLICPPPPPASSMMISGSSLMPASVTVYLKDFVTVGICLSVSSDV